MNRLAALLYGVISYAMFLAVFLYAVAWLADVYTPTTIDVGPEASTTTALVFNLVLLSIFAVQHSVMARPGFKKWWTRIVPECIERSTYVLLSNVLMIVLFWQWRPMPGTIWEFTDPVGVNVMWALFALGWVILLISTFIIDHFDLFGMRQVVLYFQGKPYTPLVFKSRLFYEVVRHPLMVGWIVAFWATPHMTVGHLVFAVTTTLYILVAIKIEEGDLVKYHGEDYAEYRRRVPMLVPFTKGRTSSKTSSSQTP
jgi:protein-S-isoprenylcysteine O-methyltransferase Ste14